MTEKNMDISFQSDSGEAETIIDEMIAKGRWYFDAVYRTFLAQAGE